MPTSVIVHDLRADDRAPCRLQGINPLIAEQEAAAIPMTVDTTHIRGSFFVEV